MVLCFVFKFCCVHERFVFNSHVNVCMFVFNSLGKERVCDDMVSYD